MSGPTTEPQPDAGPISPSDAALVAAVTSLPATMTRPVDFATDDDEGELRPVYSAEALAAAEARGWRNAVAALRSDAGRGKAARLLLDLDGEITGRTIANAMADFLESTGGQP